MVGLRNGASRLSISNRSCFGLNSEAPGARRSDVAADIILRRAINTFILTATEISSCQAIECYNSADFPLDIEAQISIIYSTFPHVSIIEVILPTYTGSKMP